MNSIHERNVSKFYNSLMYEVVTLISLGLEVTKVRLDTRGNNFLENFGDKVQIRNRTKVVEIIIRKRWFF